MASSLTVPIRMVLDDELFSIIEQLVDERVRTALGNLTVAEAAPPAAAPATPNEMLAEPLTDREMQVLAHMAEGKNADQIGRVLYLSGSTVKTHQARIRAKLDAANAPHAVGIAYRLGLLAVPR